jgi:hypothetical protein
MPPLEALMKSSISIGGSIITVDIASDDNGYTATSTPHADGAVISAMGTTYDSALIAVRDKIIAVRELRTARK